MAEQIQVTGKVSIKVQLVNTTGNLLTLGSSQDMAEVEHRPFLHNVPGDSHGGPQGPPIDIQYLGEIVLVTLEMSKWDATTLDLLRQRKVNATLGQVLESEVGSLMLSSATRVLLESSSRPVNFPTCIIREATRYAMGTKYTAAFFQFEAHRTQSGARANILWDNTTTEYTS